MLLRTPGADAGQLAQALREQAGVDIVLGSEGLVADFSRVDRNLARQWQCVALQDSQGDRKSVV